MSTVMSTVKERPTTHHSRLEDYQNSQNSPKARGERLRTLRLMASLTRNGFAKKYALSTSTIQSWEDGRAGGLTKRGASLVVQLLRQEGLYCTNEWLLYGIGNAPHAAYPHSVIRETPATYVISTETITPHLKAFKRYNENTTDLIVNDDGMLPHYKMGDYVGGKIRRGKAIEALVGLDCIVQIKDQDILLRRIKQCKPNGLYDLICVNLATHVDFPALYDQELSFAAPVIWLRRDDPFQNNPL
ncbi:MAG: helix-turn-helix transcriptional regulator [Gammaproteobacteria bacterium]